MRRILWRAGVIVTILEGIDCGWGGTQNVHFKTLLNMCRIGTGVLAQSDSGSFQHKSMFIKPSPARHLDIYDPALISCRKGKMMQNRGGANRTHAEARNHPNCRDRDHPRRGIFPRAPQAISRTRLAWPCRADFRGVLDVSWHRTGGDLFQSCGLGVVK